MIPVVSVAFCAAVSTVTPAAQTNADSKSARHELVTDIQSLLRLGIPVGLQLGVSDTLHETAPGPVEVPGDVPSREDAIARFSATWQQRFAIRETEDHVLLVLSARSARCTQALGRPLKSTAIRGTPVEVLDGIAALFDPSLQGLPPPSIVGGGGEGGGDPTRDAERQVIEVSTRSGATLLDALNSITMKASGLGWIAQDRFYQGTGWSPCSLNLLTTTAVLWTSYDGAVGLEPPKSNARP